MIEFAQIDAKDTEIVSLEGRHAPNETVYNLLKDAETEYLHGLADLQSQIRAKYEKQIELAAIGDTIDRDDYKTRDKWYQARSERLGPAIRAQFWNLYYT